MHQIILVLALLLGGCATGNITSQRLSFDSSKDSIKATVIVTERMTQSGMYCVLLASYENYGDKDYRSGSGELMVITADKDSTKHSTYFSRGLVGGGKPYTDSWYGWKVDFGKTCPKVERGTMQINVN